MTDVWTSVPDVAFALFGAFALGFIVGFVAAVEVFSRERRGR